MALGPVHRVAIAGNAAAAVLLVLLLIHAPILMEARPAAMVAMPPSPSPPAGSIVLVVVDGLRADTAADPAVMPRLCEVARSGGSGVLRVQSLIPSTVAGITSMINGIIPPPLSFLQDFAARPATDGGMFQVVQAHGGRCFVSGTRLWTDLYGRWIDQAYTTPTLHDRDEQVLAAGLAAIQRGEYRLVVVHLSRPDDAAHLHGADSQAYRASARWCDEAIGRTAAAVAPETGLIVTADHGNTNRGGHAGPEEEVLRTPLVVRGPGLPTGELGDLRQPDLSRLGLRALGLDIHQHDGGRAPPRQIVPAVVGVLALLCGLAALDAAVKGSMRWLNRAMLSLAVWSALAMLLLGWGHVGLAAALAGLAVASWPGLRKGFRMRGLMFAGAAVLAGVGVGMGRWLGAAQDHSGAMETAAGARWAVAGLLAAAGGWTVGKALLPRPRWAGAIVGSIIPALHWIAGEGLSLSTITIRPAFSIAQGPLGVPLAATVVMLLQAMVIVALVAAMARGLARLKDDGIGALAATIAAILLGEGLLGALILDWSGGRLPAGSLALAMILRAATELVFAMLTLAGMVWLTRRGRTDGERLEWADMALQCNIDRRGRRLRIWIGIICITVALGLLVAGWAWWNLALAITGGFFAIAGAFTIWEGRSGYCVARGMGIKTPI